MSDVSVEHARWARSSVVRVVALTAALPTVLLVIALYVRVGWWRMEAACAPDNAHATLHTSVSYDWSWQPLGFECTYDDGTTETSLWF